MRIVWNLILTGLLVSLLVFNLIGCGEEETTTVEATGGVYIVNGKAETLSVLDTMKSEIKNGVLNLGKIPADIKIAGDKAYVVNSGDNTIQIIDLATLVQTGLINIGTNTSPERIAFGENNKAYVSCLFTNSVKIVDITSQKVTKDIPVGIGPNGVAVASKKAYVCNPAYDFASNSYGNGTVSVIDSFSDTVTKTLDVAINPYEAVTAGSKVIILCVGNYADIMGKLCIIDSTTDTIKTIDLGTIPSGIAVSPKNVAYITTFGGLISVDITSGAMIHDAGSPLKDFAGGSGIAFSKDGNGYICIADWKGGGNDKVLVMDASEKLVATYKAGGGASIVAVRD